MSWGWGSCGAQGEPTQPSQPTAALLLSPCSEKLLKGAASIPRDSLVALGTCFGKFTKTQKFRLSVTALDFLAPYAKVGCALLPNTCLSLVPPFWQLTYFCLSLSTRCG